ncbi:uncharacterized protein K460DRAFT_359104 [Cucurbitaria berberidis CBS 394.84]|uniref:DUF7626 domain-containing protein n=1 Tax=Cucurbitaria berberidis CBS 394.84 TaxID=1168544 RepID=A0A9P4GBG0_9PLEO|nr:uncharacterized protein K460DRAFT_359104 [Cucurbitaria berberidis CBS 394.84]KAF1842505.1 hypothetical protein K460DRAFT_359104 [Cucurbitaria berberidis CBS 394.84]
MTDNESVLGSDEPIEQSNLEDNVDDVDMDTGSNDGADRDDTETPDDPADDDFKLDGYGDLGDDEDEDDAKAGYDPEYDDNVIGQKRKRIRTSIFQPTIDSVINAEAFILDDSNDFLGTLAARKPGTFGHRDRRKGETLPAYHKRVSHELDSDDELMMEMREKGFSDRQIADKLAKDGRVRYDQKSISTRIMRIRLAQAENVDFLLKEGYKEWGFDDDCLLMQAHALADIEINYEIERVRAWRFRKVSDYMRRLNKDTLFSATACRERYNALIEGTARIPIDMDDDPDARRAEMEAYRESREQVRNKEQGEKNAKEALERKTKDEAKVRNAQKAEETANKRAAKETEKAQRAMQRAAQAQVRAQRSVENHAAKAQRNAQLKKQKEDREAKRARNKRAVNANVTLTLTNIKTVTTETPDPRGYLSLQDLAKMCAGRGIQGSGKGKDQLIQELQDADEEYSQNDLKKMCRSKGLNTNGSKVQMRYQLALAAAQVCPSFAAGVEAASDDDEMADEEE